MSTINSTQLASYYSLNNNDTSGSSSTSSNAANTGNTNTTALLLAALNDASAANNSSPDSSSSDAFLLNLSPDAQNYLSSLSSGTSSTGTSSASDSFTLSSTQQAQLTAIIDKYKDAPYTQATFDDLQNDLESAGLGPDQLNAEQDMNSLNPTEMLLDALNGTTPTDQSSFTDVSSGNSTRASNYIDSILSQWQSVSTTYSASAADSSTATGTAAA